MFPASFWLNVGSGCRSHPSYCFHILCRLSNGLQKTGCLLSPPPRLWSGMPWHCFPFMEDGRRGGGGDVQEEEEEEEVEGGVKPVATTAVCYQQETSHLGLAANANSERVNPAGLSSSASQQGVICISTTHTGLGMSKHLHHCLKNTHRSSDSLPRPSSSPPFSKHHFSSSHRKQKR